MSYPERHIFRHPILTVLVLINYWQRKNGTKPDEWYWADRLLIEKTFRSFA